MFLLIDGAWLYFWWLPCGNYTTVDVVMARALCCDRVTGNSREDAVWLSFVPWLCADVLFHHALPPVSSLPPLEQRLEMLGTGGFHLSPLARSVAD